MLNYKSCFCLVILKKCLTQTIGRSVQNFGFINVLSLVIVICDRDLIADGAFLEKYYMKAPKIVFSVCVNRFKVF